MIIGEFGTPRLTICKRRYTNCMRVARTKRMRRNCALRFRNCRHGYSLHSADEFGAVDPSFIMETGTVPVWNHRDPRSQLTNAAAMTTQQAHPSMNGVDLGFSLWAWLKGDR